MSDDLGDLSLLEIFRLETESQAQVLSDALLKLERDPQDGAELEAAMRAAHSLKGASRIVGRDAGVRVAHVMEDCFVAAQKKQLLLDRPGIDLLLNGVDLLRQIAQVEEGALKEWESANQLRLGTFLEKLEQLQPAVSERVAAGASFEAELSGMGAGSMAMDTSMQFARATADRDNDERVLRVTADNLNRLLALAGESLVESRWLKPFAESLLRLKRTQDELVRGIEALRELKNRPESAEAADTVYAELHRQAIAGRRVLAEKMAEVETFDRRMANLSHRMYEEALAVRMRPIADGIAGLPRMVRDVARQLGKEVSFNVTGQSTPVDRDVLDRLEAPLGHLLRNALDHGIESPADRIASGKSPEGRITLEARHSGGMLMISIIDDGRGISLEELRQMVIARGLTNAETVENLTESELLEFLFLPGFTMKETVTDISGRGVGLDAVQTMVKELRGTVRITTEFGKGSRFQLLLPLTLSVIRTLLVEVAGEAYAFPLVSIMRTLKIPREKLEMLEGRQHFGFEGKRVGLVTAHQVLEKGDVELSAHELAVVVLGEGVHGYGIVVDRFLGERELVVQPLDPRLGKVKDISSGALMEDGTPVLIFDVEDLIRSVEKLISGGRLKRVAEGAGGRDSRAARKRILIVDDSLTVRELERKLLGNRGYEVEVAVDGMDGWNAVRTGHFQLVVTDIDMPRMDGFELVSLVKRDPHLKNTPVLIVSYKDREEDRRRGLDAGADYYLTKGSFHDETLLQAVVDLIGEPVP